MVDGEALTIHRRQKAGAPSCVIQLEGFLIVVKRGLLLILSFSGFSGNPVF
jgi:hypothetical protein